MLCGRPSLYWNLFALLARLHFCMSFPVACACVCLIVYSLFISLYSVIMCLLSARLFGSSYLYTADFPILVCLFPFFVRLTSNSLLECLWFQRVSFPCYAVVYCFVFQFMLLAGLQFVCGILPAVSLVLFLSLRTTSFFDLLAVCSLCRSFMHPLCIEFNVCSWNLFHSTCFHCRCRCCYCFCHLAVCRLACLWSPSLLFLVVATLTFWSRFPACRIHHVRSQWAGLRFLVSSGS